VIAIRATIGKPLIVPSHLDGANLTQGTAKFSPDPSISSNYVQLFLRSAGAEQEFQRLGKGATFKEITLEMLRKYRVARPPLDEQEKILSFLTQSTQPLDTLIAGTESAIALLQERRSALVSAAVTGKIDVRNLAPTAAEAA
jgi:type I restriction enzyme, S subunit